MNNADLVWHLVELLIHKEKELNQLSIDEALKHNNPTCQNQDKT